MRERTVLFQVVAESGRLNPKILAVRLIKQLWGWLDLEGLPNVLITGLKMASGQYVHEGKEVRRLSLLVTYSADRQAVGQAYLYWHVAEPGDGEGVDRHFNAHFDLKENVPEGMREPAVTAQEMIDVDGTLIVIMAIRPEQQL